LGIGHTGPSASIHPITATEGSGTGASSMRDDDLGIHGRSRYSRRTNNRYYQQSKGNKMNEAMMELQAIVNGWIRETIQNGKTEG
jgi:hypothetical protein